jgi:nitrate/TMAO reductase-like tetraheme cytochrome c subunit
MPATNGGKGSFQTRLLDWLSPVVFLSNNPISLLGVVLVTTATVLWVFLLPTLLRHETSNPYLGIPAFMILPGVFVLGLLLIPVGVILRRRNRVRQGLATSTIPVLRTDSPQLRQLLGFVAAASIANVIIFAQWGYSAVNYMDTANFCGQSCHVMQPEFTAYQNSPHAHVDCVDCHIGSGLSSFVQAKVNGMHQVMGVAFNNYSRPIPTPVANLRPARETCEHCHWPARFSGDRFVVKPMYGEDEKNESTTTVLRMKVGGPTWRGSLGIHGVHVDGNSKMVYTATDSHRQVIPEVTYTAPDGKVTVYKNPKLKAAADAPAHAEQRTMDCVDCHSRPSHTFQLPDRALDKAIANGQISPSLPFIKKQALAALRKHYSSREAGAQEIRVTLVDFYKTKYPEIAGSKAAAIQSAAGAVQGIYLSNIFPDMKIGWGTYPSNLGHTDSPGCFRCHDGDHVSADGRSIPNDCATCHDLLAMDEKDPKVLSSLGYKPDDPKMVK